MIIKHNIIAHERKVELLIQKAFPNGVWEREELKIESSKNFRSFEIKRTIRTLPLFLFKNMTTMTTVAARNDFSTVVNQASFGKKRIILTRRGKKVAAVVPLDDIELLEAIADKIDIDQAHKAINEYNQGKYTSWKAIKEDLQLS